MPRVTFHKGEKFERLERALANPERALKQIGAVMQAESLSAFKLQALGASAWPERAPVNVFGIVADFALGRTAPLARRFERRPALVDTGRLRSSIAWQIVGTHAVEVGTTVEYAAVHQFGGVSKSARMTSPVRQALWKWLRTQSTEIKRRVGWVLNRKYRDEQIEQRVPPRPFLGITDTTRAAVRKIIGVEIMETTA